MINMASSYLLWSGAWSFVMTHESENEKIKSKLLSFEGDVMTLFKANNSSYSMVFGGVTDCLPFLRGQLDVRNIFNK